MVGRQLILNTPSCCLRASTLGQGYPEDPASRQAHGSCAGAAHRHLVCSARRCAVAVAPAASIRVPVVHTPMLEWVRRGGHGKQTRADVVSRMRAPWSVLRSAWFVGLSPLRQLRRKKLAKRQNLRHHRACELRLLPASCPVPLRADASGANARRVRTTTVASGVARAPTARRTYGIIITSAVRHRRHLDPQGTGALLCVVSAVSRRAHRTEAAEAARDARAAATPELVRLCREPRQVAPRHLVRHQQPAQPTDALEAARPHVAR